MVNTHFTNTEQIKIFVDQWFLDNYGNNDNNIINQINQQCVYLGHQGVNLLEQTNLVTTREYHLLNDQNINHPVPFHIGFDTDYTGKPLIQAILEDRRLATNHIFHQNVYYNKIIELLNML
jgi:hypothetical protein